MIKEPEIIFANDDVLVIDKPFGLLVHEDGFSTEETAVDWFLRQCPEAVGVGEPGHSPQGKELNRAGVVHRLDRETSGVMILAKNQEAFWHLKKQFQDRLAKKEYRALVYGVMTEDRGSINRPIGRSARDFRLRSAQRGAKGVLREALTNWECLAKGEYAGEIFSYLRLMPQTGRTHQLRVHLKAIDKPIVGDKLYSGKKIETSSNLGLNRLALHAYTLEIVLPNEERGKYESPLPPDLAEAIERVKD